MQRKLMEQEKRSSIPESQVSTAHAPAECSHTSEHHETGTAAVQLNPVYTDNHEEMLDAPEP